MPNRIVMRYCILVLALLTLPAGAFAAEPAAVADENRDWGVASTTSLRKSLYHAPTPRAVPGARTVTTAELQALLAGEHRPFLIDVLGGVPHRTLVGAFWMAGAGAGDMTPDEETRFLSMLGNFSGGDKARPMVFFCSSAQCWLSYNAALRAVTAGYTGVMWYRGGIDAWRTANLPLSISDPFYW